MALDHLTPDERKAYVETSKEIAALKRLVTNKTKAADRSKKRKQELLEAQAKYVAENPPSPEIMAMFGPDQCGLPAHLVKDQPYDRNIDENPQLDEFIEAIARQEGFRETMGENIADPRVSKFLKLIGEPKPRTMTECAEKAGLSQADMAKIWRNTKLGRAFIRIVNRMEKVADKVTDDAMGAKKVCPRCDGLKAIEVPEQYRSFIFDNPDTEETMTICPQCEGKGYYIAVGSAPHAQLIWERVGWSKQKGGVNVNVNMADHSVDATINEMDDLEVLDVQGT